MSHHGVTSGGSRGQKDTSPIALRTQLICCSNAYAGDRSGTRPASYNHCKAIADALDLFRAGNSPLAPRTRKPGSIASTPPGRWATRPSAQPYQLRLLIFRPCSCMHAPTEDVILANVGPMRTTRTFTCVKASMDSHLKKCSSHSFVLSDHDNDPTSQYEK